MGALARALRHRMNARGFNQKSLARKAGLNETGVRDIIQGKSRHPRHDTIQKIAHALGCSVTDLLEPGDPAPPPADLPSDLAFVTVYDVAASAGQGLLIDAEHESGRLAFRAEWLRSVTGATPNDLAVITVRGDSMYPTLADGDSILVDLTQRTPARDGIYIIRFGEVVLVKRVRIAPVRHRVSISCDNANYPRIDPVDPGELDVVGRVIWLGRRL